MQEQQIHQRPSVTVLPDDIERAVLMEAMANSDMGIAFLQWLCYLTFWNRPTMTNEQSALRDLWIHLRRYIPVQKLPAIEYEELKGIQQTMRELLNAAQVVTEGEAND